MSPPPARHSPRVGIVLVNYNGMVFMPDCLASLARIDYPEARVVVIDNASRDGSPAWVREHHPEVALVELDRNTGITGGNNAGITWCREHDCDAILFLNNDTVVEPDFLSRLMAHAASDAMLVPRIYYHERRDLLNNHFGDFNYWRGTHVDRFFNRPGSAAPTTVQTGTMANTCALLCPRNLIERVGMMDDAIFLYYDDVDFITRAVALGATVKLVPDAVIYHRESSTSGGYGGPLTMYYATRNRLYFMFKHQKNPVMLAAFLAFFGATRVPLICRFILSRRPDLAQAMSRGIMDYVAGRMGAAPPGRIPAAPRPPARG
ncbi:MAG TPA: glycosyltransferase family 2 protein [Polyangia bacterium]